jgi:hypothetical protein
MKIITPFTGMHRDPKLVGKDQPDDEGNYIVSEANGVNELLVYAKGPYDAIKQYILERNDPEMFKCAIRVYDDDTASVVVRAFDLLIVRT